MRTDTGDWIGQVLSRRYQVIARLGEGGMAFVYRAWDNTLLCDVVIKVPRPEMIEDAESSARFDREIRSLVQLKHPHIVKISDVGNHEGVPFAVLEYLAGKSLSERQKTPATGAKRRLSPRELTGWLPSVAAALDFIHQQRFLHRDVKPDNILFDKAENPNAYLADFGVSKVLADDKRKKLTVLTGSGMVLGTPQYMAPEMIMGQRCDGRIDQYALAVTVYELLGGCYPFDGPSTAVFVQHTTQKPPRLDVLVPSLGEALARAVHKALAKAPAERYPDCATFARAVLQASKPQPVTAKKPAMTGRTAPPPLTRAAQPGAQPAVTRPQQGIAETGRTRQVQSETPAGGGKTVTAPQAKKRTPPTSSGKGGFRQRTKVVFGACAGVAVVAAILTLGLLARREPVKQPLANEDTSVADTFAPLDDPPPVADLPFPPELPPDEPEKTAPPPPVLQPEQAKMHLVEGMAFYREKKYREAVDAVADAVRSDATNAEAQNTLAWWLATCPDANLHDGRRAITHAEKACELAEWRNATYMDTLAAAYARAGRFPDAVKWQSEATDSIRDAERPDYRDRLELYRAGKSYPDSPQVGSAPQVIRPPVPEVKKNLSPIVGGTAGGAFQDCPDPPALLVGFNISVEQRAGVGGVIKSLQPIYQTSNGKTITGKTYGQADGKPMTKIGCVPGYAVSRLAVFGKVRVSGFCLEFKRIEGNKLGAKLAAPFQWYGGGTSRLATRLGGNSKAVIGIHGRSGTDLDALGLILRDD